MNQKLVSEGNKGLSTAAAAVRKERSGVWAFTLIELLAVIAIIGLLAGLVVGLSGLASGKGREARVRGEHSRLVSGIEGFRMEMNAYPQDNQLNGLTNVPVGDANYEARIHEHAGKNLLYYELSGAVFIQDANRSNSRFQPVGKTPGDEVTPAGLRNVFGVGGIENSARSERDVPYKGFTFKPDHYRALDVPQGTNFIVLVVPLKGPHELDGRGAGGATVKINPWFYDASSTNRHNTESYDLWAEYLTGRGTNVRVIKNWITTTRPGIPSNE